MQTRFSAISVFYDKTHPMFTRPTWSSDGTETLGQVIDDCFTQIKDRFPRDSFTVRVSPPESDHDNLLTMTLFDRHRSRGMISWKVFPGAFLYRSENENLLREITNGAADLIRSRPGKSRRLPDGVNKSNTRYSTAGSSSQNAYQRRKQLLLSNA